jgi:hypothetical protein
MAEENINSSLLFDTVSRTFNLGKILSEKTCPLSIAELRAVDGTCCLYGSGHNDFDAGNIYYKGYRKEWALKWRQAKRVPLGPKKVLSTE